MEQERLLEEGSSTNIRVRPKRNVGCQYWVAPFIVAALVVYGLTVSVVGAVFVRWSGVLIVQLLLLLGFIALGVMILWSFHRCVCG